VSDSVATTCPYCGVGCGIRVRRDKGGGIAIEGDRHHPANRGRLCSKGLALGETLDAPGRLLHPWIGGERVGWNQALDAVAEGFAAALAAYGPDSVAFYVSGQLLTEDYYVANKLMKGFLGGANIDTNSRLCMASSVAGHKRAFGTDTVPGCYEDLDGADLVVLVGSNAAWCHPILFRRIEAARRARPNHRLVVIDPRRTDSCVGADLHLALRPGTDAVLFNGLLVWLYERGVADTVFVDAHTSGVAEAVVAARQTAPSPERVAEICGLDPADVHSFYEWVAATEKTCTLYSQGVNQSSSGTDKVGAILNCHLLTGRIGRPGMGPFSLTGQPNAMGGREVGGLANQLAAHMEIGDDADRDRVARFWKAPRVADREGLKAVDLFRAVEDGQIKALWIMATNPAVSLPDADAVARALNKCDFVVVSDCVARTDTSRAADVLLPAAGWGEKDGTVTNSERRISRQRAFLPLPGEARPDWWVVTQVARRMGFADQFDYDGPAAIFREHAALSGFENDGSRDFDISALAEIGDTDYAVLRPVQWPVTAKRPKGTDRLFAKGGFFTDDRRARFRPVQPRPPVNPPDADYPFILNTGRVRDHWHTLTRTGLSARLSGHLAEPYLQIRPEDAARAGLVDGGLARINSRWGWMIARVRVSEDQRPGELFVPFHWNDSFAARGRVDALVNPETDPISGQPELKHTPVAVAPYAAAWYGFALSQAAIDPGREAGYWVRARGRGCWRTELAGEASPDDWGAWARDRLGVPDGARGWITFADPGRGRHRFAWIEDGRLRGCLFVEAGLDLPSRGWLEGLFEAPLDMAARRSLLAGSPGAGGDPGKILCSCFSVGANTIRAAIAEKGLTSVEAIGAALQAGTNCGSCRPELRRLLDAAPAGGDDAGARAARMSV